MATSGSITTNKYSTSSSGNIGLKLSWSLKSQSIANNTSTISWTLQSVGTMSSGYHIKAGPVTATINGTKVVNTTSRFDMHGDGGYKKTGTITITHTADGSKTFSMSVKAAIYSTSVNCTASGSGTPTKINRYALITANPTFTDEDNPTISYSNPAGSDLVDNIQARLKWMNGSTEVTTSYSSVLDVEGGTYTFNLDSYRSALQSASADSNMLTVTYDLKSVMNGTTEYHDTKTVQMSIVNANPVIQSSALTYSDTNSSTVQKTGSNQIIVQKQSTLTIHVDTTNSRVAPQKSATIGALGTSAYSILFNGTSYTPDSSGNVSLVNPDIAGVYATVLSVTDSRGNTNTLSKDITIQPWVNTSAICTVNRVDNFQDDTILLVNGQYSSVSGTNAIYISESHKEVGDTTWSNPATVTNNTNFYIGGQGTGLDNTCEWDVKVLVWDKYTTAEADKTVYNLRVGKGIPLVFFDKLKRSVSLNGYPDAENQLYINGNEKVTGDMESLGRLGFEGYKCKLFTVGPFSAACTTHSGSYDMYITSDRTLDISSAGFNHVYFVFSGGARNTGTNMSWVCLESWTATQVKYVVARHTSMTLSNYTACFLVIGD